MRYLVLLTLVGALSAPVMAADGPKDVRKISPQVKACYDSCKKETDNLKHEECMNKCTAEDQARMSKMGQGAPKPAK